MKRTATTAAAALACALVMAGTLCASCGSPSFAAPLMTIVQEAGE